MVVNVSPEEVHVYDTYSTLNFARKAKKIVNMVSTHESIGNIGVCSHSWRIKCWKMKFLCQHKNSPKGQSNGPVLYGHWGWQRASGRNNLFQSNFRLITYCCYFAYIIELMAEISHFPWVPRYSTVSRRITSMNLWLKLDSNIVKKVFGIAIFQ